MATGEKRQGILKEFTPAKDQNGEHKTWKNRENRIYYDFNVTFEATDSKEPKEDKGTMSSNSDSPKWVIGDEYTYNRSIHGEQGQFIKFSGHTAVDKKPYSGGGGKSKKDPIKIIRAVCLRVAHQAINDMKKSSVVTSFRVVTATANKFVKALYTTAQNDNDKEMWYENALYTAVEGIQFDKLKDPLIQGTETDGSPKKYPADYADESLRGKEILGIISSEEFVKYTELCYAYIMEGTNDDGSLKALTKTE